MQRATRSQAAQQKAQLEAQQQKSFTAQAEDSGVESGAEGTSAVKSPKKQLPTPSDNQKRKSAAQPSLFERCIGCLPAGVQSLLKNTATAVVHSIPEAIVTYAFFSVAPGIATGANKLLGLNYQGTIGLVTVPARKLAKKAFWGLINIMPFGRSKASASTKPAKPEVRKAPESKKDEDNKSKKDELPASLGQPKSFNKRAPSGRL